MCRNSTLILSSDVSKVVRGYGDQKGTLLWWKKPFRSHWSIALLHSLGGKAVWIEIFHVRCFQRMLWEDCYILLFPLLTLHLSLHLSCLLVVFFTYPTIFLYSFISLSLSTFLLQIYSNPLFISSTSFSVTFDSFFAMILLFSVKISSLEGSNILLIFKISPHEQ